MPARYGADDVEGTGIGIFDASSSFCRFFAISLSWFNARSVKTNTISGSSSTCPLRSISVTRVWGSDQCVFFSA